MFLDIGVRSPQSATIICFDNSIAYSTQNVNIPENCLHKVKTAQKSFTHSRSDIKNLAEKVNKEKPKQKQPTKTKGMEIS